MTKSCVNCKNRQENISAPLPESCLNCVAVWQNGYEPSNWEAAEEEVAKVAGDKRVDHPAHYNQGKFECIDVMKDVFGKQAVADFCILNAFKYIYRHRSKDGVNDIKKAEWYLKKYREVFYGEVE